MVKKSRERGFTLIELLVVIAIIGILSSVVLASLNTTRKKARDAKRISELKTLQLALELYYDSNPTAGYPAALPSVAPAYVSVVPTDPTNSSTYFYAYAQTGSGSGYYLGATLETTGQTGVLTGDNDTNQVVTRISGGTETLNCNANAGGAAEAVYCVSQ